jgi:hypothetical protein
MLDKQGAEIFCSGPHTIGTHLNQAQPREYRGCISKRVLGGTEKRQQFLEPQAEAAGGDLELVIERGVAPVAARTAVGGAPICEAAQQGRQGSRAQAAEGS